jgi:hypothetical protein
MERKLKEEEEVRIREEQAKIMAEEEARVREEQEKIVAEKVKHAHIFPLYFPCFAPIYHLFMNHVGEAIIGEARKGTVPRWFLGRYIAFIFN